MLSSYTHESNKAPNQLLCIVSGTYVQICAYSGMLKIRQRKMHDWTMKQKLRIGKYKTGKNGITVFMRGWQMRDLKM